MANKPKEAQPINRDGYWYLVRRVPKHLAVLEGRNTVVWSTGIAVWQDPRAIRATALVRQYDQDLQDHWNRLLTGAQSQWPREHRKNVEHAASLQLSYASNAALATASLEDLFQRFSLLVNAWGEKALVRGPYAPPMRADVAAALGGTEEPDEQDTADGVMASQMLEEYAQVKATELARKSPRQRSKWRVRRQSALDLFIAVIGGDKPFKKLTRKDVQAFRKYWQQRIEKEEVRINSANRNIRQVSGLYSVVKDFHQVEGLNIFDRIRIPGGEEGKRIPFDAGFVQNHYLAEGQFADLNPEARRIIYLCIETGVRLSEACALDRTTIHLNAPVPYIDIQAVNRTTKTKESVRKIPLVGVALLAMRAQPDGFPRYRDKADAASAVINKALDVRKLRPGGKGQTLYSMRHTIVDRLKAVEAPRDIQEDILGHKHMYGAGTALEHQQRWLLKIAFRSPGAI
jgi:integrase